MHFCQTCDLAPSPHCCHHGHHDPFHVDLLCFRRSLCSSELCRSKRQHAFIVFDVFIGSVKLCQVMSSYVKLCQVMSSYVKLCQVMSSYVKLYACRQAGLKWKSSNSDSIHQLPLTAVRWPLEAHCCRVLISTINKCQLNRQECWDK